ncbi:MAG: phosphoribosylformylglycinamidine synthase subunit PurS [Pseudomonadota bacterium]
MIRARVTITLKPGVLDPQGKAIEGALGGLGFGGVLSARQGKVVDLELDSQDADGAKADVARMCDALLVNGVVERYDIQILN